jgi:hypothetical protein
MIQRQHWLEVLLYLLLAVGLWYSQDQDLIYSVLQLL